MSGRGEGFGDAGERRGGAGRRVHFEALVAVGEASGGAGFEAESIDVSPEGMRLRAVYLPEVGDRLLCRFDGPGGEIAVEGEVCWRRDEARGGEFGLRFAEVDAGSGDAVRALCGALGAGAEVGGAAAEAAAGAEPRAESGPGRGARVRLHIEGLGSPMKARVREGRESAIEVGSNLEFLKIGRTLEMEDVDRGGRREAFVDEVRVEIEQGSRIPQLVVTLRYDEPARAARPAPARKGAQTAAGASAPAAAGAGAAAGAAAAVAPAAAAATPPAETRGAGAKGAPAAEDAGVGARGGEDGAGEETPGSASAADAGQGAADERQDADASPALEAAEADGAEPGSPPPSEAQEPASEGRRGAALRGVGQKAAAMGRSVVERAGRVGPVLSGAGARARGAMGGILARIQQKRAERDEAKKSSGPRRMTAPPPAGALRSDGRRLVRDDGAGEASEGGEADAKPRVDKKAAALGSFLGLAAVLAIFGAARLVGLGGPSSEVATSGTPQLPGAATNGSAGGEAPSSAPSSAPALPPGGGTLSANVPLFGATPLSTTEPVPPSAPPADPGAAAAQDPLAAAAAAATDGQGDEAGPGEGDEPSLGDDGKAWGQGEVRNPTVLKLKMDGEIDNLSGVAGPMGFTVSLPDRRALSTGSGLARKDRRIASLRVVNTPQGAEVTLQFRDGVPAYLAKANGNRLEIALGNDDAPKKKVASKKSRSKPKKSKKADAKKKASKGKAKKAD